MDLNFEFYRTKIFIDSNVVLEARPLDELPWKEIDTEGPILILLAPTVLKEVDSKKKDGRIGQRARDFNRKVAPLLSTSNFIRVLEAGPIVDMAIANCNKIDWGKYDDLDRGQGDACLIAEVLNTQMLSREDVVVVSQDLNPLFMAKRHGLTTHHIPATWLPTPEPSPQEKELTKLRRQVAEYAKNEPEFIVKFQSPEQPVLVHRVKSLPPAEIDLVIGKTLSDNPRIDQNRHDPYGLNRWNYDSSYNNKYDKYERDVSSHATELHKKLEVMFGQIPFNLNIENIGKVRADHLHVDVQVIGGWVNSKPIVSGMPPIAPVPRPHSLHDNFFSRSADIRPEVGRHEMEIDELERASNFSAQCADFRQGQRWAFCGVIWLDPAYEHPVKLVIKVTASNFHGEMQEVLVIEKKVKDSEVWELIDRGTHRRIADSHIEELVTKAIETKNYDALELDR